MMAWSYRSADGSLSLGGAQLLLLSDSHEPARDRTVANFSGAKRSDPALVPRHAALQLLMSGLAGIGLAPKTGGTRHGS